MQKSESGNSECLLYNLCIKHKIMRSTRMKFDDVNKPVKHSSAALFRL
jgi:hypothetical protein